MLEPLRTPRTCEIGHCDELADWQWSGCALCWVHIEAMADMNSDNERALLPALLGHIRLRPDGITCSWCGMKVRAVVLVPVDKDEDMDYLIIDGVCQTCQETYEKGHTLDRSYDEWFDVSRYV